MGDLFTGDRSSDAGPTIATRSRFPPVGRPTRLHRTREHCERYGRGTTAVRAAGRRVAHLCSPGVHLRTQRDLPASRRAVRRTRRARRAVCIRCRPPPNRIPNPMWRSPARRNVHGRVGSPSPTRWRRDWRAAGVVVEPDASPSKAVCRELTSTVSLRSDRLAAFRRTDSGKCRIPGVVARRTDKRVERERKLL